jgi:membrane-bound lytic murein transglycosylase D
MMRQKLLWLPILCLFCSISALFAQVPQVGSTLHFAGMELHITEQARRDIQSSVDAIYRSEKFFNLRLEQVDLYMPLIEPIFEKYGVPEEFKYLVIQESGLVSDAVSSSNAVGFWQFKETSATELGLRVDRQVDERMNIISATEGAAKYLLRSNAEFDNWIYSLQSYMVGQGGTSRSVDKRYYGARKIKIDDDTHWYIKKFLSHLVAYEPVTGKQTRYTVLYPYTNGANKSLRHIASEFNTDEEVLKNYNKWLKTNSIPDDKDYTVIIPVQVDQSQDLLAMTEDENEQAAKSERDNEAFGHKQQKPSKLPKASKDRLAIVELNNLKGVIAREGDKLTTLAELGNISESRFRRHNDLAYSDKIQAGQFYYLEKKRRRARVYEHVLQPGENLWQVSQQYGVRLKKLRQKNRLVNGEEPKAGRVLWLRFIRPRHMPVEHREIRTPRQPLYASTQSKPQRAESNLQEDITAVESRKEIPAQKNKTVVQLPDTTIKEIETKEKLNHSFSDTTNIKSTAPPKRTEDTGRHLMQPDTSATQQEAVQQFPVEEEPVPSNTNNSIQFEADTTERKILQEKQEKDPETNQDFQPEQESLSDSFTVEEPVNFIEAEQQTPTQNDSIHTVQAGETLYSLSRQYGLTVQDLIRWNGLPAQPVLSIGQVLRLNPAAAPQATTEEPATPATNEDNSLATDKETTAHSYHTVAPGESMYRVARMYNVTIKDIMRWNNKDNFDIKEGERLIVGSK